MPGQLIHSYVCSFETKSREGYSYFVSFIDNCSKAVFVYPMKFKSDTFSCFKLFRAMFEKSYPYSIVSLHTDNGGEYLSTAFTNHLLTSGIKHDPGPPHSPESNGVAERTNRTLNNLVRCGLVNAKLPKSFWTDCLRHVMHTFNSVPMNTPQGFKSPSEILNVPSASIHSLHPFGCLAWFKVPEANRKKLDPKAQSSILLSYLSNGAGFRLWDMERRSVVKSRDVIFDHLNFPYGSNLDKPLPPVRVELPWPLATKPSPPTEGESLDPRPSLFEGEDIPQLHFNFGRTIDRRLVASIHSPYIFPEVVLPVPPNLPADLPRSPTCLPSSSRESTPDRHMDQSPVPPSPDRSHLESLPTNLSPTPATDPAPVPSPSVSDPNPPARPTPPSSHVREPLPVSSPLQS
jgi:transposase InsO family protein